MPFSIGKYSRLSSFCEEGHQKEKEKMKKKKQQQKHAIRDAGGEDKPDLVEDES